jgi:hypothetical protein
MEAGAGKGGVMEKVGELPKCRFCTDPEAKPTDLIVHYSGEAICNDCLMELATVFAHGHPAWREEILKQLGPPLEVGNPK